MKVIYEFTEEDHELRSWVKYNSQNLSPEQLDGVDKFRTRFYEIINENQIKLD